MTDMEIGRSMIGGPAINAGPSVRVIRNGRQFHVVSTPHPLHRAVVLRSLLGGPHWAVIVDTADVKVRRFPARELKDALRHAGTIVGALYRVDMRSRFSGPQRFVMGRNLCPAKVPCPSGPSCDRRVNQGASHHHLCKRAPDSPITVWCTEHTDWPEMPGDAFVSLSDTGGD